MNANRAARVSEEIKRALSDIIRNDLHDPGLPEMFSILNVEVTNDFAHAKVYYSVLGGNSNDRDIRDALRRASGFMRRELGSRVRLRLVPELHFISDSSIEKAIALNKLIDETIQKDTAIQKDTTN